ncbi:hypothetical protein [Amycolatopsis methanolica]|uniref:hypothetical protein n=1 Tax=Amycolatopsis methanolica TaxID=1814 RepID=UPI001CC22C19|nr:hypothetical protein [Amycolatopsis methanolica]
MPSGEIRGDSYSWSGSSASTRRSPVATSIATTVGRCEPPASGTVQVVTTVRPSGETSHAASSVSARPACPVRSRSSSRSSPAGTPSATTSRVRSGPRSWSQKRMGYSSCRIADTPASLRALRSSASCSALVAEGIIGAPASTVPASAATATARTPPAGAAITRASPPEAGCSHSALLGPSSLSAAASGRAETNSRSPDGVKAAPDSPSVLRVSRRAGRSPAGSTSHSAVV